MIILVFSLLSADFVLGDDIIKEDKRVFVELSAKGEEIGSPSPPSKQTSTHRIVLLSKDDILPPSPADSFEGLF